MTEPGPRSLLCTVLPDGAVGLYIIRGAPPDGLAFAFDGRETGEAWELPTDRVVGQFMFASGEFESWLAAQTRWWAEEKRKRPWL